ncbi:MAG TPA: hypothetical protein VJ743_14585 [Albitalea sp.]|nr:hypothetical protein [Albitalea sp.]
MSNSTFPNFFTPWLQPTVDERFNNGWTFGNLIVTTANSKAPDIEREVVSRHSYGRQLGRLTDAVVAIAHRLEMQKHKDVAPLIQLAAEIDEIKKQAKRERCDQLLDELKELKRSNRAAWDELLRKVGP